MVEVTAAVIYQDGKLLICQRPEGKNCELLWEFPGGKIEIGETAEQCIIRECLEELGVIIRVHKRLTEVTYDYPNYRVHIHFFICDVVDGELTMKDHNALAWITLDDICMYSFCPADAKMLLDMDLRKVLVGGNATAQL